uniref:Uncharacterized protein n=1 Tax=Salarias fasciatus TaxID=181472 RepID=A0A672FK43_SALFA
MRTSCSGGEKDATVVVAMILCVLILARSFVQPNHPEPSCFGLDEPGSVLCLSKAFSCSGHYITRRGVPVVSRRNMKLHTLKRRRILLR